MKLLQIDSSILGAHSTSRALTKAVVDSYRAKAPGLQITHHDFGVAPLPHISPETLTLRGADASPLAYNPAFAPQQERAYPDVRPLDLPVEPGKAFDIAMAACDKNWQIVLADRVAGRIEAVEQSLWWGYRYDIVIRVTPTETGSRVDMRSKSRVGESDLGANARRIAAYLDQLAVQMRKAGA